MTRKLVILLTSLALGGVAAAAPAAPAPLPDSDDDDSADPSDPPDSLDPVNPYGPAQPQVQPQPRGQARLGIAVGARGSVDDVMQGSAAARAGIQVGDQILAIAGAPANSAESVVQAIAMRRPGEVVPISVLRNGQRLELRAQLDGGGAPRGPGMRMPRYDRNQPAPQFRQWRGNPRATPFGGDVELRRQLDAANRRIDELERRLEQLERAK